MPRKYGWLPTSTGRELSFRKRIGNGKPASREKIKYGIDKQIGNRLWNIVPLQGGGENRVNPRRLLQLEGAAVLLVSLLFYHWSQGSWLPFALLFLLPDLSMLGYAANVRVGGITYNAVHTYVGPLVLAGYSFGSNRPAIVSLSLIWIAHIGFDRMLGFGLKYPTRFNDTHLNPDRHGLSIG